jgi:hypothetical protein
MALCLDYVSSSSLAVAHWGVSRTANNGCISLKLPGRRLWALHELPGNSGRTPNHPQT